ncbi:hypothetical protein KW811_22625, partial [Enterobacter quasiroggenkampii]|uniref:hypothetical protein n=1 Tax=Enterobacter quasiroggenkampii TaxID=2497436 RepID=UPI0021D191CA
MKGIAVIDTLKIFRESAPAEQGRGHLKKVREALVTGPTALDADYGDKRSRPSRQAMENGVKRLGQHYQVEKYTVNRNVCDILT